MNSLSGFIPHGFCFQWDPRVLWLNVLSDGLIAIAYFTIPAVIVVFARRRPELQFRPLYVLFAAFILGCGLSHVAMIWTVWQPDYLLEGSVKAFTAAVSVVTAIVAWRLLPQLEALPSPARLEAANAALRQTVEELESFTYTVSHDLRAPLRAVDGYTQMVLEDEPGALSPEGERKLALVRASAAHMSRLIDGLLQYSRLSRVEPSRERVDLRDLAHDVVAEMERAGELGRARVEIGELPAVSADRRLVRQVLVELLRNAVKFTSKAEIPRVDLLPGTEDGRAVVVVKDNGAGFDMKHADRLFGVFQRLHHPDEFPGTGVGLAITKRILERHGERIRAVASPGEGATFTFTVTAYDDATPAQEASA